MCRAIAARGNVSPMREAREALAYPPGVPQSVPYVPGNPHPLVAGDPAAVFYREKYELAGSYATVADLQDISLAENSSHDFSTRSMEKWLRIATSRMNSRWVQRWELPLKKWSEAVVWACSEIAFAGLVGKRGYKPDGSSEKTVGEREDDAWDWVKAAQNYEVTPDPILILAEPAKVATMHSDVPRGWSAYSRRGPRGGSGGYGSGGFFR